MSRIQTGLDLSLCDIPLQPVRRFLLVVDRPHLDLVELIVIDVELESETIVLGALADSVKAVFEMKGEQIEPPPSIGTRLDTEFIKGMGKQDDHFIIILDIDKVFSAEEVAIVQDAGKAASYEDTDVGDEGKGNVKSSKKKSQTKKAAGKKSASKKPADEQETQVSEETVPSPPSAV